jgi:hypothetical protein
VLALIVVFSTTVAFASLYYESRQSGEHLTLFSLLNIGAIVVGSIAVMCLMRHVMAMRFLHVPELGSDHYPLRLGKHVTLQFFQRRKRPCEVTAVSLQISCHMVESCKDQHDVEQHWHTVVLWEEKRTFDVLPIDEANEMITGTLELLISDNVRRSSDDVEWTIFTQTQIAGRPPYCARFVIEVK